MARCMEKSWAISQNDRPFLIHLWLTMIKQLGPLTHGERYWWVMQAKMWAMGAGPLTQSEGLGILPYVIPQGSQ